MKSQKSITPFKNMYPIITGGSVVTIGSYKIHTFTSSGTFTVIRGGKIEFLLVAGGGGGGSGDNAYGGGGGGGSGGLIHQTDYIISTGTKSVTIGLGGTGAVQNSGLIGTNGGNSVFDIYTTIGGGAGGYAGVVSTPPNTGGSGGGAAYIGTVGANGTLGQGNKGGDWAGTNSAAGGGGATGAGQSDFAIPPNSDGGAGGTGYIFEGTEYSKGGKGGSQILITPPAFIQNSGNGGYGGYPTALSNGENGADGVFIIKYKYK